MVIKLSDFSLCQHLGAVCRLEAAPHPVLLPTEDSFLTDGACSTGSCHTTTPGCGAGAHLPCAPIAGEGCHRLSQYSAGLRLLIPAVETSVLLCAVGVADESESMQSI